MKASLFHIANKYLYHSNSRGLTHGIIDILNNDVSFAIQGISLTMDEQTLIYSTSLEEREEGMRVYLYHPIWTQ